MDNRPERPERHLPNRVVILMLERGKTIAISQVTLGSLMDTPTSSLTTNTVTHPHLAYAVGSEAWFHISLAMLTFVTGLVDAVGYLALGHVFTANMTGNVVLLGFAAVHVPGLSIMRSLSALFFAFVGGVVSGRLEERYRPKGRRAWLAVVGSAETLLLLTATIFAYSHSASSTLAASTVLVLIGLTAVSMGIRNGTVRHLGVPDITTTVLTLTVAGLSSESSLGGGTNPRWGRRVTAILSMLLGALAGAVLLRFSLAATLGAAALLTAVASAIHRLCVPDEIGEQRGA
jgi:uncharacterized membrane protein YoaK (UPF0700 family)